MLMYMSTMSLRGSRRPALAVVLSSGLGLALLTLAGLPVGAQTAPAGGSTCPVLELANPQPGDQVSSGAYVVSGVAFDPVASNRLVSKIDFFLGARDNGGKFLGSFVPPAGSTQRSFKATITLPNVNRIDSFFAYAYSALSSATTSVEVPIQVGSIPPREADQPRTTAATVTVKSGCPTATVSPTAGVMVAPAAAPVVAVRPAQGPRLVVANPTANDIISRGAYVSYGIAFDAASTEGPGVAQVDFFLGARESGGRILGSVTPGLAGGQLGAYSARLSIPSTANGGYDFVAYARSSLTGLETVVTVPVFVGVRPVPTPKV
jgi:hypothetical protein